MSYNPFAAVPSLHFGYALIIGLSAARQMRPRITRLAAGGYPALVLVIITTGIHHC
jgi:PAP2 superfamily